MASIQSYYRLAKPGIVYGNTIHLIAAGLFAMSLNGIRPVPLLGATVGVALIIASACVVNCITDRFVDSKMDRTKRRPLPAGEVSVRGAVVYAIVLGMLGAGITLFVANAITLLLAVLCHVTYTVVYAYAKRHTWLSTMVGTVPGALPALAGYAAIDPSLPPAAWALTLMILLWQLPHFYGLALYRRDDYAKSGLPLISVVKPRSLVVQHTLVTAILYALAATLAYLYVRTHWLAGVVLVVSAYVWVVYVLLTPGRGTDAWARKVFGTSLYMPIFFVLAGVIAVAMKLLGTVQ